MLKYISLLGMVFSTIGIIASMMSGNIALVMFNSIFFIWNGVLLVRNVKLESRGKC